MEPSIRSRSSWIPLQALLLAYTTPGHYHLYLLSRPVKTSPFQKAHYLNIDPDTGLIRMVYKRGLTKAWEEALPVATAVKGSSFAIVSQSDKNK